MSHFYISKWVICHMGQDRTFEEIFEYVSLSVPFIRSSYLEACVIFLSKQKKEKLLTLNG